jgi:soluble lytic murein transglycosylase-like protein
VSAAALGGLEPIAAAGTGGGEPVAASTATAAGERVQQLHALLAELEHGPAGSGGVSGASNTFASALDAAQSGSESSAATGGAYPSSEPFAGATSATPTADAYVAPASTSDAAYTSLLPVDEYTSATPTASVYTTSDTPTTVADTAAPVGGGAAEEGSAYAPLIEQAAARYGLDPAILSGLIQQESGFDPSARSSAGALGLTQLMPSTAASLGVAEPLDPAQSIEGGARYLSQLLHQFAGNTADALAAYNAGPAAVQQYGGVPPYSETQQYVTKVLGYAAAYGQSGGITTPETTA